MGRQVLDEVKRSEVGWDVDRSRAELGKMATH